MKRQVMRRLERSCGVISTNTSSPAIDTCMRPAQRMAGN
ncbi:hypothetical protein N177_2937 [Lutibaculum baratangense AMV1]|uniref:Uncharacterized protein n=1 Tax=Lutibaculum baratangense AMV1 TaxID=631454 RepID=V4QVB3_9HYPH|nr:hypothetical protein N177_2937 [Lutibaculum baratangense AMV1]